MYKKSKDGFTLVELVVAIVFVSILLLTIAVVTLNMVHIYHKGITMKSINSVGLALVDEFSSSLSASPVVNVKALCAGLANENEVQDCENDNAQDFIFQQFYFVVDKTKNGTTTHPNLPVAGIFCTGKYSYIWNTGFAIQNKQGNSINETHTMSSGFYNYGDGSNIFPLGIMDSTNHPELGTNPYYFRLQKFLDTSRSLCFNSFPIDSGKVYYPLNFDKTDTTNNRTTNTGHYYVDSDAPNSITTELISKINTYLSNSNMPALKISDELITTNDIAIYDIKIEKPILSSDGRALYSGSFVLGSITGDIDINPVDSNNEYSSCNFEDTSAFDFEYCATNKFNFAVRAMGGNSGN